MLKERRPHDELDVNTRCLPTGAIEEVVRAGAGWIVPLRISRVVEAGARGKSGREQFCG
jgi:hypothetical protein